VEITTDSVADGLVDKASTASPIPRLAKSSFSRRSMGPSGAHAEEKQVHVSIAIGKCDSS